MAVMLTVDGTAGSTSDRNSRVVGVRTPPLLAAGGEITVVFGRSLPLVEVLTRGPGKERGLRWKSAPLRLLRLAIGILRILLVHSSMDAAYNGDKVYGVFAMVHMQQERLIDMWNNADITIQNIISSIPGELLTCSAIVIVLFPSA